MVDANATEPKIMKCSIQDCPGEYEVRQIIHPVRVRGQVVVVDHVPAEVCPICGDVLLRAETVRRIEELLANVRHPAATAPLLEYA
jgi:YgiT-type zinc finger domain-containing protein